MKFKGEVNCYKERLLPRQRGRWNKYRNDDNVVIKEMKVKLIYKALMK